MADIPTLAEFCQRIPVRPIPGEPARWFVGSASRPDVTHIVDTDWEGGYGCSCEHFQVRGIECNHILAVRAKLEHERKTKN